MKTPALDLQPGDLLAFSRAAGCAIRPGRYLLVRVKTDWTCWAGQIALDVREVNTAGKPIGDARLAYVSTAGITVLKSSVQVNNERCRRAQAARAAKNQLASIPAQRRSPEPMTRRKAS